MLTALRFNVPKLFVSCLRCRRQVEVPVRGALPADVTVPCECEAGHGPELALLLMYPSQKDPFAIIPLQEGPPGWRV